MYYTYYIILCINTYYFNTGDGYTVSQGALGGVSGAHMRAGTGDEDREPGGAGRAGREGLGMVVALEPS